MATAVTEPSLPTIGRYRFRAGASKTLLSRQLLWMAGQAGAAAALTAGGVAAASPALMVAGSLGLAVFVANISRPAQAAAVGTAAAGGIWLLSLLIDGSASVFALQILLAGAIIGAGLAWLSADLDRWQVLQTTLAGVTAIGLGWWVATRLLGGLPTDSLYAALHGAIFGLVASQSMVVSALRYSSTQRIPSPRKIKATLRPAYHPPCLKAHRLDVELSRHAPDRDIRDGLGEIAAWIYTLQWNLQVMDREIEEISDMELQQRVVRLYEEAEQTDDDFIRERRIAAAQHLERLASHRESLLRERSRIDAMVEYAAAYQEEARASLVLARMHPSDDIPARLQAVLTRLRSHSQERQVTRRTAREVAQITPTLQSHT